MTNCSDSDAVVCWGIWSLEAKVTLALPPPWAVFISKQNYQKSQQDTVLELRINHWVYIFFPIFSYESPQCFIIHEQNCDI